MKYRLEAIINGKESVSKTFKTREAANKYLDKIVNDKNLEVNEIITKGNKHNVEFICDSYNRVFINRI